MNDSILVCVAMKMEAKLLLDKIESCDYKKILGFDFYTGKMGNNNIIVGISGIGLINMSSMISVAVSNFKINSLINYGLSGGYGNLHIGDIVIGSECININSFCDSVDNLVTFSDESFNKLVIYNGSSMLIDTTKKINYDNIHFLRLGSGDVWNKNADKIKMLSTKYNVACEDMESIAVYQLADKYELPCISIRCISNNEILSESYDESVIDNLIDFVYRYLLINK